jgi:hypothetical protein
MSITSITQVLALVEEEKAKVEQTITEFATKQLCYARNKALQPAIWAKEQADQIKEELEEKTLITFFEKQLDDAEKLLVKANKRLADIQAEINRAAAIQERVLALLRADGIDVSFFLDCSLDPPESLGSIADQLTAAVDVAVSVEGEVDVSVAVGVPDINVPIPDVVEDAKEAAARVGGIAGSVKAIKQRQELIGDELEEKGL